MSSTPGKLSGSFPPFPPPEDNPLLHAHDTPPLDRIKPEHFLPAVHTAVAEAQKKINVIAHNPAAPTFQNTIEALEFAGSDVTRIAGIFCSMAAACSTNEMRKAEPAVRVALARHTGAVIANEALFARVEALHGVRLVDPEQQMLLDRTYKKFVRSGARLDADARTALHRIETELSRLQTLFQANHTESIGNYKKIITDENELSGVPDRLRAQYKQAAREAGLPAAWLIRLEPPGLSIPSDITAYADNRALREELHRAGYTVAAEGPHDNRGVIMDIVRLRHEKARMLGYPHYAAFALDDRMAKTPDAVMGFLERCRDIYKPAAEDHLRQVRAFSGLADFQPWDFAYYNRKYQENEFGIDLESLRPYFALENVIEGWRQHAEKFFNVRIEKADGKYPVHHPDVRVFEYFDNKTGEMLGVLHGDYHARPGDKSATSRMDPIRERGLENGKDACAIAGILCNFPPSPALLSIREINWFFFHELGHGMHSLMAKGKYPSLNGTNVQWDILELPSQLHESYALEPEVLSAFAVHYQTGERLAPDIIKRALALEKSNTAYVGLLETCMSLLDMKWHMTDPGKIAGADALENEVMAANWIFPQKIGNMSASVLDPLFIDDNMPAGFYSYKWAKSLVADIMEQLKEKDLYDPQLTGRLRHTIHEKGGTVAPKALFMEALGRKPDLNALFRHEGLSPDKKRAGDKSPPPLQKPRP